jgi:hypothetical protein
LSKSFIYFVKDGCKYSKIWHNIDARRLDAPLIQVAGILIAGLDGS